MLLVDDDAIRLKAIELTLKNSQQNCKPAALHSLRAKTVLSIGTLPSRAFYNCQCASLVSSKKSIGLADGTRQCARLCSLVRLLGRLELQALYQMQVRITRIWNRCCNSRSHSETPGGDKSLERCMSMTYSPLIACRERMAIA